MCKLRVSTLLPALLVSTVTAGPPTSADGGVTYRDIARSPASGLDYERVRSPRDAIFDRIKESGFTFPEGLLEVPFKSRGAPGVAILDADGDGDLDLYVTNGPGTANSLFLNQLVETGELTFVDVGEASGAGAKDQDSNGVCFGDIDNDGDPDLVVVAPIEPNRLLENRGVDGDGNLTFVDITATAGVGGGDRSSSSCAMGDIDGDGLLDIVVGNTHTDWTNYDAILIPFVTNEHNQLYRNTGGNVFEDVSAASGIETFAGVPPELPGAATLTWAIAFVDVDLDGDVDLVHADDQGGVPFPGEEAGVSYGLIRLFENDGTGHFTDVGIDRGLSKPGDWMGLSFGDFNCDGHLDLFGTNTGDYPPLFPPLPPNLGRFTSRWFLARGDGTWSDPGVGELISTVFGWGTSAFDYDNDGDVDIVYHGDLDVGQFISAINPGAFLQNQGCEARFLADLTALPEPTRHSRRNVQGMASGDLDRDGFTDIVSVANFTIPEGVPLLPTAFEIGPFDATAFYVASFVPSAGDPFFLEWTGVELANGNLSVEISDAGSGHNWLAVEALGTVDLVDGGRVNRDGIGAVVRVRTQPRGARPMRPVLGGGSYASQDSLELVFGLGEKRRALVDVYWPGGTRNRLYGARAGERIVFPEIPCSFTAEWDSLLEYADCVADALYELEAEGHLDAPARDRFFVSALRALFDERRFRGG